jgi:hypothetical protein
MKRFDWIQLFKRPYRIYTQLTFWIVVFFLYILLQEYPERMSGITMICLVTQVTLELAIPAHTQNLLIVPLFTRKRWFLGGLLYLIQLGALIMLLPFVLNAVGWVFGKLFHVTDLVDWRNEHIAFSVVAFTVIATCVKIALDRLILNKEQKEAELRHLKAQLNPHFLFNTLNNLYGLSVAESKKLPDLMLKLSDLLRYSLYDTGHHYVPLQKELDYVANYVELERIRLSEKTDIRLVLDGDPTDQYIAPLLLIVFVENSFKHFSAAQGEPSFVHASIDFHDGRLHMIVRNSVDPATVPNTTHPKKGGLGLNNVRQRLDLMYPKQHALRINRGVTFFEADLQIDLT